MLGRFDNERYTSDGWFQLEQKQIFSKLWIFFCLKPMVDRPNRFMTREIAGVPIVVQNFDGEIRAFRNICLHRQFKLQQEDFGERRLICGYHGWRYGADGGVAGIPLNEPYHRLPVDESCALKLQSFHLKIVGQLVFINLDKDPLPIEAQFNAQILNDLTSMSESFDREILISKIKCNYNWKLIYENLRDVIHARFLHPSTLTQDVVIEPDPLPDDYLARLGHTPDLSDLSAGGPVHPFTQDQTPSFASKVDRWGQTDAYFTWLLFPNTHIVSPNGGYTFSIEHHMPVGPGETEMTVYYFTAKTKGALPSSVLWEHLQGAKAVLDEDNAAMEQIQAGIGRGPSFATLGGGEFDIAGVQNWIAANVGAQQ